MATKHNLRSWFPAYATTGDLAIAVVRFETNNTSDPDGVVPANAGYTIARAGVGDFTITWDEDKKPQDILAGLCYAEEDDAELKVHYTGYTLSTGVATVTVYDDPTAGTQEADDTTDKTIVCVFLYKRTDDGVVQ